MSDPPSAYTINHEGLKLDIALVETKNLLIHEEIIPDRLDKLKTSILRDGVQSAPILVDRDTYVVLDGMHRTAIMREIDCRFTCVCLFDYFDPRITVQRWCRMISAPFNQMDLKSIEDELGLIIRPYDLVGSPDENYSLLLLFKDKTYEIIVDEDDIVNEFRKVYKLEQKLIAQGYEVEHCTESEADTYLSDGSFEASLYLPKVEKEQVLEIAKEERVFTPKATRHRLPARPVAVNVPLKLLRNKEISVEEANKRLAELLADRTVTRYDPGTVWMGRTYDEVLYVFSDF